MENPAALIPAGFWRRLLAHGIDALLLSPLYKIIFTDTRESYFNTQLIVLLISYVYFFCFYTRFGATIGKLVAGIRVVRIDGSKINFFTVFKRKCVDVGLETVRLLTMGFVIFGSSEELFQSIPSNERLIAIYLTTPILSVVMMIWGFWVFADGVMLLFNPTKRAAHDFIGGTRAIQVPSIVSKTYF